MKSDTPFLNPTLKRLVGQVEFLKPDELSGPPVDRRRLLGKQDSEESLKVMGLICRCPECLKAEVVSSVAEMSEHSAAAAGDTLNVLAQRGGHKRALRRPGAAETEGMIRPAAVATMPKPAAAGATDFIKKP
eukprot:4112140-Pyramimonas_sp.AAC.1